MESTLPPITEAEILAQVVSPEEPDLSPEVAGAILRLAFRGKALTKMRELLDKNNRGLLNAAEQSDMEKYLRVGAVFGFDAGQSAALAAAAECHYLRGSP